MAIISELTGGFGNQLFQYALGRKLADKFQSTLLLDLQHYNTDSHRTYSLGGLNIQANILSEENRKIFFQNRTIRQKYVYKYLWIKDKRIVYESGFEYDSSVLECNPPLWVSGYWQSEKYFSNIRKYLLQEISPKKELSADFQKLAKKIRSSESIAIHVRRGDYVKNRDASLLMGALPMEYYSTAIQYTKQKLGDFTYYIFSDDIDWCKRNFKFDISLVYVETLSSFEEDFFLMTLCDHNIVANSTFSWWAAWLNQNKTKIVVSPKRWFKQNRFSTQDLIPTEWIQL